MTFDFAARHEHLRLATTVPPGPRRPRKGGGPRPIIYPERAKHASDLGEQAGRVQKVHAARRAVLGVDPRLVLVLTVNRDITPEEFQTAGLTAVDVGDRKAVVAFADDTELTEFHERRRKYANGLGGDAGPNQRKTAPHERFFDAIDTLRGWLPDDALSHALAADLRSRGGTDLQTVLRLDVQCWCPEDVADARRQHGEVAAAVKAAGGQVLDTAFRHWAGLSLMRVLLPAGRVRELAATDRVRSIDLLPRPVLAFPDVWYAGPHSLPPVAAPAPDAPLLAVVDSGVRSAHPLIKPALAGAEKISPHFADGEDGHGHGTFVASLALFGPLEPLLEDRSPLRPAARLLSLKVLDENAQFPDSRLWETELLSAVEHAAAQGARIVNLSLGDPRRPQRGRRATPLAAALDALTRELNLILVVSAGNYERDRFPGAPEVVATYIENLLGDSEATILDPAGSALALTVGGLCAPGGSGHSAPRDELHLRPVGQPGWPSPATRCGPGPLGMVKPELAASAGSYAYHEDLRRLVNDPSVSVIGASGRRPDQLLASDCGTSFAAPLVANIAAGVAARYPGLSANAVRALTMASVGEVTVPLERSKPSKLRRDAERLRGFGEPDARRAETSGDHRAVLVSDTRIALDEVHLYQVPIPLTFNESGGWRRIAAALAYDPPVRSTRLDYMASDMHFQIFKDASIDEVRLAYIADQDDMAADQTSDSDDEETNVPRQLRSRRIGLQPADSIRGRGANQYASCTLRKRLTTTGDLVVAVRNTNKWDIPGATQRYALAVVLQRDEDYRDLYQELRAKLEAQIQQEIKLEG
jgi:hypothetical protein